MPSRASTFLAAFALAIPLATACSSESAEETTTPEGPRNVTTPPEQQPVPGKPGETDIVFGEGTTFGKRDCDLTLRVASTASEVKLAGEMTGWASGARPMTKTATGFEIKLTPDAQTESGKLYAYKIIADGDWRIDPSAKYRKIVDGQMNSGLRLPACNAGPEIASNELTATASGTMKVRITIRSASDGERPTRLKASLDKKTIAAGTWKIDEANGAVDFDFGGAASLAKGKHTLSLRAVDAKDRSAEAIDLPFWVEDEPFSYKDGLLYMMMLDRFANGDTSNDNPIGLPLHYDADWHGGDLQGALAVLESGYFDKLGVRTIWLSPLNAQTSKYESGDGNQLFSAYHGYWPIKSREVEPRFGGDAALRAFVAAAHARGIRVLLDLINNQVHKDHEYVAPNASWFRTACKCGDDGCGWSQRPFDCMFQPYLPDIDWNQGGAESQFIADAVSWISEFDLDGFRVDAVKHVESNSVYNMRAELTRRFEQGGARVFMVGETAVGEFDSGTFFGETFSDGYAWIDAYTGPTALDGQFDFPTRHNMADGLANGDMPLDQVEAAIAKAEARYRPESLHVRFLNGHDNPRIASIAAKDPKLACTWASGCRDAELPPLAYDDPAVYARLKRAMTVLFTLPGVPYLYMGDEVAFGGGADPDMRRNMLFGDAALAKVEMSKPGSTKPTLTAAQLDLRSWLHKLAATRKGSHALRRGTRRTLLGNEGDLWVYAFAGTDPKDVAIIAINRGAAVSGRAISAGALSLSGLTLASALGTGTASASGGNLSLSLGAGEAAIFVAR